MIYVKKLEMVDEYDRVVYRVESRQNAEEELNKAIKFFMDTEGIGKKSAIKSFLTDLDKELKEYFKMSK